MNRKIVIALGCFGAMAMVFCGALLRPDVFSQETGEIVSTINYLKSQEASPWSFMAQAGVGESPSSLEELKSVPQEQKSALAYSKYILALASLGNNPTNFGNEDYAAKLKSYFNNAQFGQETWLNDDMWAILALGALGQGYSTEAQKAKDFLLSHQNADGGWSYQIGAGSDTNDTAAAIMALFEAGVAKNNTAIEKARNYLRSSQNDDGGFGYASGELSDSCSNAWVINAIYKLDEIPGAANWSKDAKNPLTSLDTFRDSDGGYWWQKAGDNKMCTAYAALALAQKSFPVDTIFNEHLLRIESREKTLCNIKAHGVTALGLVTQAALDCSLQLTISDYPNLGLYLAKINQESDWMYQVNNHSPSVGAGSYYLALGDEVLWYAGEWLDKGWLPTKLLSAETNGQFKLQAQYFEATSSSWKNFARSVKLSISGQEMDTDQSGQLNLNLSIFSPGLHSLTIERQVIDGVGYIQSQAIDLRIGDVPSGHQAGLKVEIVGIKPKEGAEQDSISFMVSPDSFDFGKLKAGEHSESTLNLQNGQTGINIQAEVSGDDIFKDNLKIAGETYNNFSSQLEPNQARQVALRLQVPASYSGGSGVKEGELTFWATKK